jgi:hypothetical protein
VVILGMGRTDPKNKIASFSIGYDSLFTMFPQLWINEIEKRGENWGYSLPL